MKMGMLMDKIDIDSDMFFCLWDFTMIWRWWGWDTDGDQHQQSCNADQQHGSTWYRIIPIPYNGDQESSVYTYGCWERVRELASRVILRETWGVSHAANMSLANFVWRMVAWCFWMNSSHQDVLSVRPPGHCLKCCVLRWTVGSSKDLPASLQAIQPTWPSTSRRIPSESKTMLGWRLGRLGWRIYVDFGRWFLDGSWMYTEHGQCWRNHGVFIKSRG